ncbi:centromere/kinetochore protein zw10 homolog [Rhopilema esculentum]|uniref:centromere/kinetochore protein zw10 homolog n=1 Tax=Rhopilema esculentum TaxID=499914 RepID=UPI0031D2234E
MAARLDSTSGEPAKVVATKNMDDQASLMKGSPSIVADVLSKKGLSSATALSQAMKELSDKTDSLKSQMYGVIYKQYTEFYHEFNLGDELNKQLVRLIKGINKLGDDIQNETLVTMATAGSELHQLTSDYEKNHEIIKALKKLLKMHDCIHTCANGIHYKDYLPAAKSVRDMRNHLNELSAETCEIRVFKAITEEYRGKKAVLVSVLESNWSQLIDWSSVDSVSWDNIESHLRTSLRVRSPDPKTHGVVSLTSLFQAMEYIGIFEARLKSFAKKMLNYLLKPFVKFPNLKPMVENDKLKIVKEDIKIKGKRIDPVSLIRKLGTVVQFVVKHVFPEVLENGKSSETTTDNGVQEAAKNDYSKKLKSYIWPELSELIIKDCLSNAVPSNNTQIKEYEIVIKVTNVFEQELISLGFLDEGDTDLSTYVKGINIHFANKKIQDLLEKARSLMTLEIHSMVKVEEDEDRARLVTHVEEKERKFTKETNLLLAGLKDIPEGSFATKIFKFPECRISESTMKLRDLVYKTLIEASMATPQVAIQLFYCVRNMFELFCDVVPTYHRESLELPQLAALHYNNSMYLAHHCITLGHQFKLTLPETLSQGAATFIDLVPVLRKCGEKCFLDNLKKQKLQLLEIVTVCDGFRSLDNEDDAFATQKAFDQIISQLVRLSRVWKDVLPKHVYDVSLELLFHTVLDTIISQIIQLEDISSEQAIQFHRLLKILIDRSVEVFTLKAKDEVTSSDMGFIVKIPSWQKFNELREMMDSSLQGIVDRWTDGKGPLAQCFDATDVRSLIKALFQNTDIRAQALSKIKQT